MSDGMADSDLTKPVYLSPADWQQLNRALEEGYKSLAKDPEMSRPNRKSFGHHCGFDFADDQQTAICTCGSVATNPFYTVKGEQK